MASVLPFYSHSKGPHRAFSNFYTPASFQIQTSQLLEPLDLTKSQKQHIIDTHGESLHILFSEQAFMLGKAFAFYFKDARNAAVVHSMIKAKKPAQVKKLGGRGSLQGFDDRVWHPVREEVMYIACLEKFQQNDGIKSTLLDTGNMILVEAAPYDKIWGVGMSIGHRDIGDPSKWQGLNLLGLTLMKVRDALDTKAAKLTVNVRAVKPVKPVKPRVTVRPVKPVKPIKPKAKSKPKTKPDFMLEGAPIYKSMSYIFSDPVQAAASLRDNGVVVVPCCSKSETADIYKTMKKEIGSFPEYYGETTAKLTYATTDPVTNAYSITVQHGKHHNVFEGNASKESQLVQVEKACQRYSEKPTIKVLGSFQALGQFPYTNGTPCTSNMLWSGLCDVPAIRVF